MDHDPGAELVALYDDGRPVGVAPRHRVRARNLPHAATAVVVRNTAGDVYVHRRTNGKDVYPGRYDFCAGGVVRAGELPADSAAREVAEELGVTGVQLLSLGESDYADVSARYHAFLFTCTYDGTITWQPDEVAWGAWVAPRRLATMIDELDFVPDSVALLHRWLDALRA
ncbi:NUDIX domain-containing protein [Isoptericola sp. S6320L]|uniref:NUDIX hydrolase n=1 Tax=Isoptericola sp. S6320L TaxID=2926411 RepID=UPI001FF1F002|nr:NUDIX domain-containing protein [Isoptericola sp. S6320L]MCK0116408.1 NUDIX domain-containing protein [Isoptericola sp. S6320L]